MMLLPVTVAVMVVVVQVEVLVGAVRREGDRRDAQAGKAASEALPPRKLALVSPGLAVKSVSVTAYQLLGYGVD